MGKRIGKYKVSDRDSELSLKDGGTIEGALTVAGTATLNEAVTLSAGSTQIVPSLVGLTASGSIATHAAPTLAADTIHTVNFTGAAAEACTLPAATIGTVVVYICTIDTQGGTNKLSFDCAGSDVFREGSVIESRSGNAVTFDTSTSGETKIEFTPVNQDNDNFICAGSKFTFWCSTKGTWDVHLEPKADPTGDGLVGTCLFAA
jgi:hypothetical protein